MEEIEKSNYHFHRHNLNASTDESDVFKQAHLRRKLLAHNFYASLSLSNNTTTCHLLEEDLKLYSSLVDSRTSGSVNNYADAALSLASHCKSESKEWKSNLKSFRQEIGSLINEMKCVKCADWMPPENFLKMLSQPSNTSATILTVPVGRKLPDKCNISSNEQPKLTTPRRDLLSSNMPVGKGTSASDMMRTNKKTKENIDSLELPSDFRAVGRNSPVQTALPQPVLRTDFQANKTTSDTSSDFSEHFPKRPVASSSVSNPGSCWNTSGPGNSIPSNSAVDTGSRWNISGPSGTRNSTGLDTNSCWNSPGPGMSVSTGPAVDTGSRWSASGPSITSNSPVDTNSCWNTAGPGNVRKDTVNFGKDFAGGGNFFGSDGQGKNSSDGFRRDFEKPTRGGHFGSNRGRDAPNLGTKRFPDEGQKNYQDSDAGMSSMASNFFKTARDELVEQNAKKNTGRDEGFGGSHGRGSYNYDNNGNNNSGPSRGGNLQYGAQKRSLGTARRAGVLNKFVPPVRPAEDDEYNGQRDGRKDQKASSNEGELDERLKNIDPKMIELIRNEIMDISAPVSWEDIAGLEFAKSTIQEIVVWPMLRPDIFTGLRKPPKGLLLFGPPGTGKTLIGKCIASQSQSTFFSISASSLTSKWIGDGEKMVRALFAVAKCHQPAVVFIDEIDSLLTQRSDTEHESSRRIKTEFLVQLDGAGTGDEERILVVGATNRPQELDEAARRRLVKRLYIPLPEFEARRQIVERLMSTEKSALSPEEIDEIGRLTDGYSGADMKNLCQEASLGPIRSLSFAAMHQITADEVRPVSFEDFRTALSRVRASVSKKDLDQYVAWDQTYGMSGASF